MGYHRAGFDEIVGIDIEPMPRYPFTFIQGDALNPSVDLSDFDLIHASPPCQAYSVQTNMHDKSQYPDLIPTTRDLLKSAGVPYIVENVPGAPLINHVRICGSGLGMRRIRRHRWFEASFPIVGVPCDHSINVDILSVAGHGEGGSHRGGTKRGSYWGVEAKQAAMGIDWMNRDELSQAIPPRFTLHLALQFLDQRAAA